ncbi:MAG: class I SAM-dependent methyltransferase [Natronomonas sp.]
MAVPCVRVPRESGESIRQVLAEHDLISDDFEIEREGDLLYIPLVGVPDDLETLLGAQDVDLAEEAGVALDADVSVDAPVVDELAVVDRDPNPRTTQTLPRDLLGFEPSYERLGDIVILDEDDEERARAIAEAIMASDLPVKTVLDRASPIEGERRIRQWQHLAGDGTETVHREYGCAFELDIAEVYFSPRLATERRRVTEQVADGERFFDMFAGVGPFVIPAALRGAEAVGVDVNEAAIDYLVRNADRNGVSDQVTAIYGDVRDVEGYDDWADRIVMNLPHSADEFLATAMELAGNACTIHYYDIQHEDDPFGPGEVAIRRAAGTEYEVSVETRRVVRSYAPHEENVCLDVRLEAD